MASPRTALIIGGGIAGPVTAVALQQVGISATVYEAHPRTADHVGAFLGLNVNGIAALRAVDMDGPVVARGFATPRMVIANGRGTVLADFPNGGALSDGTQAITITRPDLYAALREQAAARGIHTEYGKRLLGADRLPDHVRARFADGTVAEADMLVGADGIHSTVRQLLDPAAPQASYVGFLNTGGYASGLDVRAEPGVSHLVFGRRCFLGYTKDPAGTVWWFANPPSPTEPDPQTLAATPPEQWRAWLMALFADDVSPALELIEHTAHIFTGWNTYDMPSVPTWHDERMVVIGDAAHAVSPSAGQGAALAIEDAVTLAQCLRDHGDAAQAFTRYEQLRRDRVERVAAQGRRNGNGKTSGPVGAFVRDLFMPLAMRRMFRHGRDPLDWMWNHQIDWTASTLAPGDEMAG